MRGQASEGHEVIDPAHRTGEVLGGLLHTSHDSPTPVSPAA
jgi:hypothetical protein